MSSDLELRREIEDSEKAILASVLYYFPEIEGLVDVESIPNNQFVNLNAKRIWQAIKSTKLVDGKYDQVLVLDNLKNFCLNSKELERCIAYLNELPHDIHYFSVNKYLQLLRMSKIKRDLDALAEKIIRKNLNLDNFNDEIENWKSDFNLITSHNTSVNFTDSSTAIKEFDELVEAINQQGSANFLKTRFGELDKKIKSLSGGQLVVIASRPGVGKTTFALNLIHNNFDYIKKEEGLSKQPAIGVFSLEMTTSSLLSKLIALEARIELNKVQRLLDGSSLTSIDSQIIDLSKKRISNVNLLFCDETNITVGKIASTIKTWIKEYDLKLVIVDYLQLVSVPEDRKHENTNQYQKIGLISRTLKILSMELNVCIVSLAQLNRKAEERRGGEKSPILSDLRESGSIEQDSDIVMFLYEEKEQNAQTDEEGFTPELDDDSVTTMLKIAKNRHGPVGKIEFKFDKVFGVYKLAN